MSDVEKYISQRKKTDPEFAEGFEDGYRGFEIDILDIGEEEWLKAAANNPAFRFFGSLLSRMPEEESRVSSEPWEGRDPEWPKWRALYPP